MTLTLKTAMYAETLERFQQMMQFKYKMGHKDVTYFTQQPTENNHNLMPHPVQIRPHTTSIIPWWGRRGGGDLGISHLYKIARKIKILKTSIFVLLALV